MKPYGLKDKKVQVCSCCLQDCKSFKYRSNKSSARMKAKAEARKHMQLSKALDQNEDR